MTYTDAGRNVGPSFHRLISLHTARLKGARPLKEHRNPANVHQPIAAYTHQIEIREPERLLVLSGQVGRREDGSVPEDPIEQLDLALENLQRNLQVANMDVAGLIKITGTCLRRKPLLSKPPLSVERHLSGWHAQSEHLQ